MNGNLYTPLQSFIFKGTTVINNQAAPNAWTDLDLSAVIGPRKALVVLQISNLGAAAKDVRLRPNGDTGAPAGDWIHNSGLTGMNLLTNTTGALICYTDTAGILEVKTNNNENWTVKVAGYFL